MGELTELVVCQALHDLGKILRGRPDFSLNINVTGTDLADPRFFPCWNALWPPPKWRHRA